MIEESWRDGWAEADEGAHRLRGTFDTTVPKNLTVRIIGTRLTPESHTNKAIGVSGDGTVRTKVLDALRGIPWPKEYSFRILGNMLTDEWADREDEAFRAFGAQSAKYAQARARGDLDTVAVVCGEVVGLLKDRPPAAAIVKSMVAQAANLVHNGGKLKFT